MNHSLKLSALVLVAALSHAQESSQSLKYRVTAGLSQDTLTFDSNAVASPKSYTSLYFQGGLASDAYRANVKVAKKISSNEKFITNEPTLQFATSSTNDNTGLAYAPALTPGLKSIEVNDVALTAGTANNQPLTASKSGQTIEVIIGDSAAEYAVDSQYGATIKVFPSGVAAVTHTDSLEVEAEVGMDVWTNLFFSIQWRTVTHTNDETTVVVTNGTGAAVTKSVDHDVSAFSLGAEATIYESDSMQVTFATSQSLTATYKTDGADDEDASFNSTSLAVSYSPNN